MERLNTYRLQLMLTGFNSFFIKSHNCSFLSQRKFKLADRYSFVTVVQNNLDCKTVESFSVITKLL